MSRIPAALTVVVFGMSCFLNCSDCLAKGAFKLPACPAVEKEDKVAPSEGALDPIGLKAPKGSTVKPTTAIDQARKINAVPLALIQSETELEKQRQLGIDSERRQLTDLWTATINRSEDIRFVLTALQPTSNPKHSASTTMKFVSGALFNVIQSAPLMMPAGTGSMPLKIGAGVGGGMLSSLFGKSQSNAAEISREQGCILYTMIRNIADKLVENYRNYRRALDEYESAQNDLAELDEMSNAARATWEAADQFQFEYTIRRSRRDARTCEQRALLRKLQLSDLAGPEAMQKLDEDIAKEKETMANLLNAPRTPLEPVPAQSADSSTQKPPVTVPKQH